MKGFSLANTGLTRRRFLQSTFAFSAAALLQGCGSGYAPGFTDTVVDDPSHLLAVGDWGISTGATDQSIVATAMQTYAKKWIASVDGLLMLGDNFYGNLTGGVNSSRWKTQFEDMYPASVFNCPAIAVPGNHDYQNAPQSKVAAQLAYAARGTSRFTMPSLYRIFPFPTVNPNITMITLDSNMPNEKSQPIPPDKSYYTPSDADRQAQLDWLEAALQQKRYTPFTIVVGHHPLYSNGPHGDNATLIRDWDPLFRQYKVDLYIAGHDHDLQHLEFDGHPTSFVTSGGGGAELNTVNTKRGPFAQEAHGFTHLQVTEELMIVRHIDVNGHLLHKFTKTPDGVVTITPPRAAT